MLVIFFWDLCFGMIDGMVSYWLPKIYRFNESFSYWDYRFDYFPKVFTDKLTLSYISEVRGGQLTVSRILRYQVWNHKEVSIFTRQTAPWGWQVFHVRGQIVTTMWCEKSLTSNFIGPKSDVQVLKLSNGFWHEFKTILQRCQDFFSHGLIISCQNTFRKWMQTCFAGRIEASFPKGPCMHVANIRSTYVYIYIYIYTYIYTIFLSLGHSKL